MSCDHEMLDACWLFATMWYERPKRVRARCSRRVLQRRTRVSSRTAASTRVRPGPDNTTAAVAGNKRALHNSSRGVGSLLVVL